VNTLSWIIVATLAGGILSAVMAGLFAIKAKASQIPMLVSYAVGALLGAAFIEVLPHAFEKATASRPPLPPYCSAYWDSSSSKNWCCGDTAMSRNAKPMTRISRHNRITAMTTAAAV